MASTSLGCLLAAMATIRAEVTGRKPRNIAGGQQPIALSTPFPKPDDFSDWVATQPTRPLTRCTFPLFGWGVSCLGQRFGSTARLEITTAVAGGLGEIDRTRGSRGGREVKGELAPSGFEFFGVYVSFNRRSNTWPIARSGAVGSFAPSTDVLELWQVSPCTIQRLIKSGALRASRIGRLVRISDEDAEDFLDNNQDD